MNPNDPKYHKTFTLLIMGQVGKTCEKLRGETQIPCPLISDIYCSVLVIPSDQQDSEVAIDVSKNSIWKILSSLW